MEEEEEEEEEEEGEGVSQTGLEEVATMSMHFSLSCRLVRMTVEGPRRCRSPQALMASSSDEIVRPVKNSASVWFGVTMLAMGN